MTFTPLLTERDFSGVKFPFKFLFCFSNSNSHTNQGTHTHTHIQTQTHTHVIRFVLCSALFYGAKCFFSENHLDPICGRLKVISLSKRTNNTCQSEKYSMPKLLVWEKLMLASKISLDIIVTQSCSKYR